MEDWLKDLTRKSTEYWMGRVQHLIEEHTSEVAEESDFGTQEGLAEENVKIKGHGNTDSRWFHVLYAEVRESCMDPINPEFGFFPYDGNMRIAAVMGTICLLWYSSTQRAKLLDPARPTGLRLAGWNRTQEWTQYMLRILTDFSQLPTYFPGQQWHFPWDPNQTGGSFL